MEHFAGETLAVHAGEHLFPILHVAVHDGRVLVGSARLVVHDDPHVPVLRGHHRLGVAEYAVIRMLGTTGHA
jgi:hypothetical protein